jgi:hypothetical protein
MPRKILRDGQRFLLSRPLKSVRQEVASEGVSRLFFRTPHAIFLDNYDGTADPPEARGRVEVEFDLQVSQRMLLRPRFEATLAAREMPELGINSVLFLSKQACACATKFAGNLRLMLALAGNASLAVRPIWLVPPVKTVVPGSLMLE